MAKILKEVFVTAQTSVEEEKESATKQKAEKITKNVFEKLQEKYPTLNIVFNDVQKGDSKFKIPDSYLFDIWMEPLIFKQVPTTIALLVLNEDILQERVEASIKDFIDNMTREMENNLKTVYPKAKIVYKGVGVMMGNLFLFSLECPPIIDSSTSISSKDLSKHTLLKELKKTLYKYEKAYSKKNGV